MRSVYKLDVKFENSIELLRKFLSLYSSAVNLNSDSGYLRPRLVEILSFYVMKGYSPETKSFILESIPGMTRKNLNQINAELSKLGYLGKESMRSHFRSVPKALIDLKAYLDSNKDSNPLFVVEMINKQ